MAPSRRSLAALCWILLGTELHAAKGPQFDADVLPIIRAKCLACHSGSGAQAQLDLQTEASVRKGGKSGPAIVAGSSDKSLLVAKISSRTMPPGDVKLTDAEIARIRAWIDQGIAVAAVTEDDVLPIFQMRCVVCHGKRKQEGGLDLRTQASRLKGGKSGPALAPGKPEESLIVKRIAAGEMPPPKLLFDNSVRPPTSAELEVLRNWIAAGAAAAPKRVLAADQGPDPLVSDKDRQFWAFHPHQRPPVPRVKHQELVRHPIDAFLLEKLEAKGLSFSPEADRLTVLRRAYLDLIGIPPEPSELEEFLNDKRPDSYERLIDRLLASPHYGERWAQFWLDGAGYSDSEGKVEADVIRPHAWRYRDYVIRSLNQDKPYDQFLMEQIAGDEMVEYKSAKQVTPAILEKLVATGFLRMAPDGTYSPPQSFLPERMNVIADQIEVLSSSVMGLTMGCARCHDHKYDPLPQRDYYRLSAILQSAYDPYDWVIPTQRHLNVGLDGERREAEAHNAPIEAEIKRLEEALETLARPFREKVLNERLAGLPQGLPQDLRALLGTPEDKRTDVQKYLAEKFQDTLKITVEELARKFAEFKPEADRLRKAIDEAKKKLREKPHVRALYDMGGEPSPVYLLRRGDALSPGELLEPGVPSVLRTGLEPYRVTPPWPGADTSGRRLALGRWLAQPNHPLTARVLVNRVWMHRFGRGIVASASNFGRTGAPPSHPELLDWLAAEFVRSGWSIKALHRLMMTSTAYRQSSRVEPAARDLDPDNILLSRMPLRRMDAEVLHDSILQATGRLDPAQFGPPAEIEVRPDGEVVAKGSQAGWRRSIYVLQRRKTPVTLLEIFDVPPMSPNCIQRPQSTVATQALQMRNGELLQQHARYLAGRLIDEAGENRERQVEQAYLRILSRRPAAEEMNTVLSSMAEMEKQWVQHLENEKDAAPKAPTARWRALAGVCHTLLSSAEFSYID